MNENPVLSLGKDNLRHTSIFDVVPNAQMLDQLIAMGFAKEVAEQSLIHTKNKNLQLAMDWVLEHPNGISSEEHQNFVNANSTPAVASQTKSEEFVSQPKEVTNKAQPEIHLESRYAKIEEEKRKHRERQRLQEAERIQREKRERQIEKERVLKRMQEDKENRKKDTIFTRSIYSNHITDIRYKFHP